MNMRAKNNGPLIETNVAQKCHYIMHRQTQILINKDFYQLITGGTAVVFLADDNIFILNA